MLVVDASCLYEVLVGAERSEAVRAELALGTDHAAPQVLDVEVFSLVRRDFLLGRLDQTAASQAVEDLGDWGGERYGHRKLLARAWELRYKVRSWDAMYVALAEALGATLLTADRRLGRVDGLACPVRVVAGSR